MEYRRLGRAGLQVSALSFGTWVTFGHQVDLDTAEACLVEAYEAGVNFFDNSESYARGRSERVLGELLSKLGWRRDSFIVSSKVFWGTVKDPKPTQRGLSRKHVHDACHQALERLQLDYLDLFFCHRPDPETPIEETVRAMDTLVRQGKVLYWGTSEWNAQQLTEAYAVAGRLGLTPPTMEQPEYNMFRRQRVETEFVPLYRDYGLGTTIWSPLASGLLTGKYNDGIPEDARANLEGYEWLHDHFSSEEGQRKIAKVRQLSGLAQEFGTTMPRLALAWCLKNPHVSTVITGASRVSQVQENMKAVDDVAKLTEDVLQQIEAILQNKPKE